MNPSAPMNAGGWISTEGYRFFLRGDVELQDLFRLDDVLGLPVAHPAAEGLAKLDVSLSGLWKGFATPVAVGAAQLRNVRAEMHGLNTPIVISSATMTLDPEAVKIEKISARTESTHWSGGARAPRQCSPPLGAPAVAPNCVFQFDLTADELSTGDLVEWFTPHPLKLPWYRILNSNSNSDSSSSSDHAQAGSPLLAIRARGNLHVGRFGLNKAFATQVATKVDVDRGKITLGGLRAQLLEGTHEGDWTIDVSNPGAPDSEVSNHDSSPPTVRYHGAGTLHDISLEQVSVLMNDAWIAGTADGKFDFDGSGDSFGELLERSDVNLRFVMRNGGLSHVEIPGSPVPLPVHRFAGELSLKKDAWELSWGRLESRDGIYQVSGTASATSGLDLVLTRGDEQSWSLTGTIANPHVEPVDRAEADASAVKP